MKKLLLFAFMICCCSSVVNAQSRTARKATTVKNRTVAGKITSKASTAPIVIDDPVFVNGHLAFQGTSLDADGNTLLDRLYATGKYTDMERSKYTTGGGVQGKWHGGKEITIIVEDNGIHLTETSTMTKSSALARIKSLANAYNKASGGRLKIDSDRYTIYYPDAVIWFELEPVSYELNNNKYHISATFNDKP